MSRCLRDDESLCPICGVAYSKERFQTLFDLVATSPQYTPLPLEAEDTERVLRRRCLTVNETTPLSILRDILGACNRFLDDQPRNKVGWLCILSSIILWALICDLALVYRTRESRAFPRLSDQSGGDYRSNVALDGIAGGNGPAPQPTPRRGERRESA